MVEHDEYEKINGLEKAIATHDYLDFDQWSEYEVKCLEMSKLPVRKTSDVSTDRQDMTELFYRFGNLFNLRTQLALNSLISTPDFFPESLSSRGHLLIEELSCKLSSVTNEMVHYADFDPKQDCLPKFSVNLLPKRTGGVCDLAKLGANKYLMKNDGVVELLNWTKGKYNPQTHCITERHFWDDMEGIGWEGKDLKAFLGWKARDFIDDSSTKSSKASQSGLPSCTDMNYVKYADSILLKDKTDVNGCMYRSFMMRCNFKELLKKSPEAAEVHKEAIANPTFWPAHHIIKTLPFKFLDDLVVGHWKKLPKNYRRNLWKCITDSEKEMVGRIGLYCFVKYHEKAKYEQIYNVLIMK